MVLFKVFSRRLKSPPFVKRYDPMYWECKLFHADPGNTALWHI